MESHREQQVWERVCAGNHTAVIGRPPGSPPPSLGLVRIRCDAPWRTLGPVFEAQREIEHLLGGPTPLMDQARQARQWFLTGLRRRLLGELPDFGSEGDLVDACNRLSSQTRQPYALVFDAVDAADDITLALLARIVQRPGWLRMPLLLVFRHPVQGGPAAQLLDGLRAAGGPEAVLALEPRPDQTGEHPGDQAASSWRSLPADVLQVLRAGAVIGPGFEAELVASLIDRDAMEVYGCLQRASDAGVPLEDRGDGRFSLTDAWMGELGASLLPSLRAAWHRKLGALLAGEEDTGAPDQSREHPGASRAPETRERAGADRGDTPGRQARAAVSEGAARPAPGRAERMPWHDRPAVSFAGVFDAPEPADPRPDQDVVPDTGPAAPARPDHADMLPDRPGSVARAPQRGPLPDPARAAGHLREAGDIEAAAERYMIAAGQAAAVGAFGQAMAHVQRALALMERLPTTDERRRFRIRTLVTLARLQSQAIDPAGSGPDSGPDSGADTGPGTGPAAEHGRAFTLGSALETVDAAIQELHDEDPIELVIEARALAAGICYDLGDPPSLERALDELTRASKLLLDAGDSVGAARLLNDQAATYVRLGDPVRATHLLTQSLRVFESRADSDPVTMVELAETHHLLARLPFHARIRSGREDEAYTMSMDHARTAEGWYRKLGASRELARVWETMGRIELRRQRPEQAGEHLSRALQVQSRILDVTGMARTTAAMSEVLSMRGMPRNALMVLGDSIALNLDKGSPIGLAFNRRAYDALRRDLLTETSPEVQSALAEVGARLEEAETVLGRVELPDASLA